MNGIGKLLFVGLITLGVGACARTRLPSLEPSSPHAEKLQFERFYPYAEEEAGPATESQPRGYELPRSEPNRMQRPPRPTLGF